MSLLLALLGVFSLILSAYCAYAVFNAGSVVKFTVNKYTDLLRFYGFEASIVPTERTESIIRTGHSIMFFLFLMYSGFVLMILAETGRVCMR